MNNSKTLVVYYSRTGTTRKLAEEISRIFASDVEEINDLKNRSGPIGWLGAGRDAGNKSLTKINKPKLNPRDYDLVIIGSPAWNGTISASIRTYITENRETIGKNALFLTGFAPDNSNIILEVAGLLKVKPLASLYIKNKLIQSDNYKEKLDEFIVSIWGSDSIA